MIKKLKPQYLFNFLFLIFLGFIIFFIIKLLINEHLVWFAALAILVEIVNFVLALMIFMSNKNHNAKISWLIAIITFPIVGHFLYIFSGLNFNNRKYHRLVEKHFIENEIIDFEDEQKWFLKNNDDVEIKRIVKFISTITNNYIHNNSTIKFIDDGNEKYNLLFKHLRNAKNFIHIEYYLIHDGDIFRELKSILIEKANQGLEIRILLDDMGLMAFPTKHIFDLKKVGIKIARQNKLYFPFLTSAQNYRNHRKIVIIDNEVAFFGGMNVGDEYISKSKKFGYWRDSHYIVTGTIIRSLAILFAKDWVRWTKELLIDNKYLIAMPTGNEDGNTLLIPSGPNDKHFTMKNILLKLINSANKSILITTPYFSPDSDIIEALKNSAMSGVEIKILIPGKADKQLVYFMTKIKASELIEYGAKIYYYKNTFVHKKTFVFDHKFAIVGSINLDHRALFLNFELSAFVYNASLVYNLEKSFRDDLKHSKLLNGRNLEKENYFIKAKNLFFRFAEPLF